MSRYLLDSSFLVDLLNEIADCDASGPALKWMRRNRRAQLWISPVTLAEILEDAEDPDAIKAYLGRFAWQGIHRIQAEIAAVTDDTIRAEVNLRSSAQSPGRRSCACPSAGEALQWHASSRRTKSASLSPASSAASSGTARGT